jgi:spermidine/putrescine ABC transporter ATP-binding subunit
MKPIVRLINLTKRFGDVVAAENISLDVEKGEFISLLGPSGSGKTTTLMMIAGFHIPTSGAIFIEDEMVIYKPPYKRNIGMVFQNYALFPHITVFENIAFPLRMRKIRKEELSKHVQKALDLVELSDFGRRYPNQLSGGQQQRVALARSLVYNPPVLLMDEPLGALDKKLRDHMQLEIKHIHQSLGITVIYVTHDQVEALTMSDRIAVMNLGRIEQIGAPIDLYNRPENKFVADFIGETNLIEAKAVEVKDSKIQLVTSKGLKILASQRLTKSNRDVTVAIRPERIHFIKSPNEQLNAYWGLIQETIYLGDTFKYKILVDECELFIVTEKNDSGSNPHSEGERVLIGWQNEDMNLL